MWARLENNIVVELTDIDPKNRFHPDLIWVKCFENTTYGMFYNGKQFSNLPEETDLEE